VKKWCACTPHEKSAVRRRWRTGAALIVPTWSGLRLGLGLGLALGSDLAWG